MIAIKKLNRLIIKILKLGRTKMTTIQKFRELTASFEIGGLINTVTPKLQNLKLFFQKLNELNCKFFKLEGPK